MLRIEEPHIRQLSEIVLEFSHKLVIRTRKRGFLHEVLESKKVLGCRGKQRCAIERYLHHLLATRTTVTSPIPATKTQHADS